MTTLAGKQVLVTGAAGGIGRQTAFAFAELGAHLWLGDVNQEALERTALLCRKLGVTARTRVVDVADTETMRAWADEVNGQIGALDVLVNNAGVGAGGMLLDTDLETWDWIMGINIKGVANGCRLFAPAMVERGTGGHIVNVASAAGLSAPPGMGAYAATKFAVVGLSEALRAELLPDRIEVTTVCPGVINTGIVRSIRLTKQFQDLGLGEQAVSRYRKRNYGPEKVADAIVHAVKKTRGGVLPVSPEAWGLHLAKRLAPGLTGWLSAQAAKRNRA